MKAAKHGSAPDAVGRGRGPAANGSRAGRSWTLLVAGALAAVVSGAQALVNFLALGADGELLRIPARCPDLAAEGNHGFTGQRGFHDLFLAHVVREAFPVTGLHFLAQLFALDGCRGRSSPGKLAHRVVFERVR